MKRTIFALVLFFVISPMQIAQAQEAYIGEIKMFGANFCPRNWSPADGALVAVSANEALFSLYGTTYGGDGRTTFALPDFRGRVPVFWGTGPGLSSYSLGGKGGTEEVTLTTNQMPAHSHAVPELNSPSGTDEGIVLRRGSGNTSTNTLPAGNGFAHENRMPYIAVTVCVATIGIYPSRN